MPELRRGIAGAGIAALQVPLNTEELTGQVTLAAPAVAAAS
jgi:hypothetical protein